MLEHRAAVQQRLVQQDTEELRRFSLSRGQVLARLWKIANLDPEMTRSSASAQVKTLSLIVAIEGLIPDRRAASVPNQPAPLPVNRVNPPFYVSEWMRTQQNGESVDPQPATARKEAAPEPQSAPGSTDDHPTPDPAPTQLLSRPETSGVEGPAVPAPLNPPQTISSLPRVPTADYVAPDTRRPFSIDNNRFGRRR